MSTVNFTLNFMSSSTLQGPLVHRFFAEVAQRQVCAFELRCRQVYGPPTVETETPCLATPPPS